MRSGVRILEEEVGAGPEVGPSDFIVVRASCALTKGDLLYGDREETVCISDRNLIAGYRYGIEGMRVGGRRKFRVSPHLAYREMGTGVVPPNAVLIFEVTVLRISSIQD